MNKKGLTTIGGVIAMILLLGITIVTLYFCTVFLGSINPYPIIP